MSEMGIGTISVGTSSAANLNQAQNTALFDFVAPRPLMVVRYGAIAVTGGILSAGALKLRKNTLALPATFADVGTLADQQIGPLETAAVGAGVSKKVGEQPAAGTGLTSYHIKPGETIRVAVEVAAGNTSTAQLFVEYVPLPFAGDLVSHVTDL